VGDPRRAGKAYIIYKASDKQGLFAFNMSCFLVGLLGFLKFFSKRGHCFFWFQKLIIGMFVPLIDPVGLYFVSAFAFQMLAFQLIYTCQISA